MRLFSPSLAITMSASYWAASAWSSAHVGLKHQLHAQCQAALLQDVEQVLAPDAAKPWPVERTERPLKNTSMSSQWLKRITNQAARSPGLPCAGCPASGRTAPRPSQKYRTAGCAPPHDPVAGVLRCFISKRKVQTGRTAANAQDIHEK
jgi:hypothetical protein